MVERAGKNPIGRKLFQFLGELTFNNERTWFETNRERYESEVREPALALIRELQPRVREISRHILVSDKKAGGSLMRIHRDVRFAKDKSPYKTNVGISMRHAAGKDIHAPGLYLHLSIDDLFLGAGMWHPDAEALGAVRQSIVDKPAAWKKARDQAAFRKWWELSGESLKRPPRGFDPEHPCIDDLKRKDFIAVSKLTKRAVTAGDFVDVAVERFRAARPFLAWQAKALGLEF